MKNNNRKYLYTFSKSPLELYAVRYSAIIPALVTALVYLWGILDGNYKGYEHLFRFSIIFAFLGLFHVLLHIYSYKTAYKISVDIQENQMIFEMFKKNRVFALNIDKLTRVHANFYITFIFSDTKILYNGVGDDGLIDVIENSKTIEWGIFGRLISGRNHI